MITSVLLDLANRCIRLVKGIISLGICAVRAVIWLDLLGSLSASNRERSPVTGVKGPVIKPWPV